MLSRLQAPHDSDLESPTLNSSRQRPTLTFPVRNSSFSVHPSFACHHPTLRPSPVFDQLRRDFPVRIYRRSPAAFHHPTPLACTTVAPRRSLFKFGHRLLACLVRAVEDAGASFALSSPLSLLSLPSWRNMRQSGIPVRSLQTAACVPPHFTEQAAVNNNQSGRD